MTDTTANNRTAGLAVGLLSLAVSLPLPWFTIKAAPDRGMFTDAIPTGLNGSVGLTGLNLPIWFVLLLGVLALLLAALNHRRLTTLPRWTFVAPWLVSCLHVLLAVELGLFSDRGAFQIGPVPALIGLTLGAWVLRETWWPTRRS